MPNGVNRLGLDALTLLGMPPVEHVRLAAELGCASVSLAPARFNLPAMGRPGPELYPDWSLARDAALRRELKAALADTGVHVALGEGFLVAPGRDVRDHAAGLDIMAELGARRVNAVSLEFDLSRAYDQLAVLADLVCARGIRFIVEFAPPNAINTLAGALGALEHVGRDRCQVMFDAMHLFRSGGAVADVAALDPNLIGYAQMCDAPLKAPEGRPYLDEAVFGRLYPGEGELPLADWVAALPADCGIGLEVPRLAELRAGLSPRDHAARAVEAARALGA